MAEPKITAEMLRAQMKEMDELKKQGDEQMFGVLEDIMMATSEIDINEFVKDLKKIMED